MTVAWGYAGRDLAGRHDFDDDVTRAAAASTNDRCSNPYCKALTSGSTNDRTKSLNVGVILPISGMTPEGHRYDPTLSDTERHGEVNAIWLCYTCARQVNSDPVRYPADLLRAWKRKPR
jgi:hypothetical protein